MQEFTLRDEYIKLGQALKACGLVENGKVRINNNAPCSVSATVVMRAKEENVLKKMMLTFLHVFQTLKILPQILIYLISNNRGYI